MLQNGELLIGQLLSRKRRAMCRDIVV
jgi:hypothetical protein